MIDNRTFFVEYESLENICVTCGFYGHKAGCCPTLHTVQPLPGQPEEEVPPNGSIPEGDTGDWMIVQRRSRNKAKKVPVTAPEIKGSGSRFDPIASSSEKISHGAMPSKPAKETREKRGRRRHVYTRVTIGGSASPSSLLAESEDREGNPKGSTVSSSSTPCRRF
ncbi:hypothetical protein LINPERPRIM_LOCUS29694 [Linum perenne]